MPPSSVFSMRSAGDFGGAVTTTSPTTRKKIEPVHRASRPPRKSSFRKRPIRPVPFIVRSFLSSMAVVIQGIPKWPGAPVEMEGQMLQLQNVPPRDYKYQVQLDMVQVKHLLAGRAAATHAVGGAILCDNMP